MVQERSDLMINKLENKEYIIVEIIPTSPNPEKGDIAQLSALKLNGLTLVDRFDYRLNEDNINNIYIKEMINYDKENFIKIKKWHQGRRRCIYAPCFLTCNIRNRNGDILRYRICRYTIWRQALFC